MSGWPAVRTRPAPPREVGGWPVAAGCLVALVALPLAAAGLLLLDAVAGGEDPLAPPRLAQGVLALVAASPLLSWPFLLLGVPLALWAARAGLAGWLVAAAAGAVAGLAGWALLSRPVQGAEASFALDAADLPAMALVGAVLGLAFWLGVRLANPRLFRP